MGYKIGGTIGRLVDSARKTVDTIKGGGVDGAVELGRVLSGQHSGIGATSSASIGKSVSGAQSAPAYTPEEVAAQQQAIAEANIAKGLDASGMPIKPGYTDANWRTVGSHNVAPTAMTANNFVGIDQMRTIAKGNNPWVALAKKNQALQQKGLLDTATRAQQGADAQARANMAMRGGIRGGAAERLARNSAWNQMQAGQNIYQQGALQQGNIDLQGEQMRQDILGKLASGEQAYTNNYDTQNQASADRGLKADALNAQYTIDAAKNKNDWESQNYATGMAGWGAGQTADAIAKSNSGYKPTVLGEWDPTGFVNKYQRANQTR